MWHRRIFWLIVVLTAVAIASRAGEYTASPAWAVGMLLSVGTGVAINALIMYAIWLAFKWVRTTVRGER